jgi:Fe-S-cluster containining protein
MGHNTVNFKCHSCRHCCRDVVCLPTPWDVIRIVNGTGLHPSRFIEFIRPDEVSGVNKGDPTWLECTSGRFIMAVKRDATKGCHFLHPKTSLCKIYEHRPILCRLYPYQLHETRDGAFKSFSLHTKVECPRNRDGEVETAPLYAMYCEDRENQQDYADLVDVFNRQQHDKPEDFIEFAIMGPAR